MSPHTLELLLIAAAVLLFGIAIGALATHEWALHRWMTHPTVIDLTVPAARGELAAFIEDEWDWPACATPRDERATPRSLSAGRGAPRREATQATKGTGS